jgi:hypothetical protein
MPYTPPVYPSTIPSTTDLPDRVDDVDYYYAARYNEIKKELLAALTELGTLPKGAFGSVKLRLEDIEADIAALTTPTIKSIIPRSSNQDVSYNEGATPGDYTIGQFGHFNLPAQITVNHISLYCSDAGLVASTFDIKIYAEDGQSVKISLTTPEISTTGVKKFTLGSPVTLPAGNYYFAIIANTDGYVPAFAIWARNNDPLGNDTTDERIFMGAKLDCSPGTLPDTFDPTALTAADYECYYFRLDN